MTARPTPDMASVTQADRDAAGDFTRILLASGKAYRDSRSLSAFEYRGGQLDADPLVQAFARHRLAALARSSVELGGGG